MVANKYVVSWPFPQEHYVYAVSVEMNLQQWHKANYDLHIT